MAIDSPGVASDGNRRGADGGGCGDSVSCCPGLVCTAAQRCAASCNKTGGNCTSSNDCCRATYCDSTSTCVASRGPGLTCAHDIECCGASCGPPDGPAPTCATS